MSKYENENAQIKDYNRMKKSSSLPSIKSHHSNKKNNIELPVLSRDYNDKLRQYKELEMKKRIELYPKNKLLKSSVVILLISIVSNFDASCEFKMPFAVLKSSVLFTTNLFLLLFFFFSSLFIIIGSLDKNDFNAFTEELRLFTNCSISFIKLSSAEINS